MNKLPKILLVEDDEFAAMFTAEMLAPDYDLRHADCGQAALQILAEDQPDLVLLDVAMPGMTGYEVCKAMRCDPAFIDLPVIFLSGKVSEEERLAGYEAGGDDYLTKPVSAEELRAKIKLQLTTHAERIHLKQDISSAFSTAMTAMSSMAELGTVLQFMRTSFSCPDYQALCHEVLKAISSYGLEASVKIHGEQGEISCSPNGPCSPLEDSVLSNMRRQGRMFEFGARTSFSWERITIILKRVDRSDPERYGRMKDNISLLAEGADARIVAMDSAAVVVSQHKTLTQLTKSTKNALHDIEHSHQAQGVKLNQIFQELQKKFDDSMIFLGINNSQEDELASMILEADQQARAMYDEGLKLGSHMKDILRQLEGG
jgi:DNA-binding response OmpR family regulator